jgi:hypothetical protein
LPAARAAPQPLIAAPRKYPLWAHREQNIERPVQATILHARLRTVTHNGLGKGVIMLEATHHVRNQWQRRNVLKLLAAAGCAVPAAATTALAEEGSKTTEGAAWLLGDNLSIAALLYNQNASKDTVDRFMAKAKKIADIFGLTIKPFPAKAASSSASSADMIHYLIQGEGAALGTALARKYNDAHGALFEVAVKSNLLILLYGPGDSLGRSIADVIKSRLTKIHLPENLWGNVVTLVNNKGTVDAVKQAVFKMHKDIADYFIPGSG